MYIEQVNSPQDIKQFSAEQLRQLAGEVRNALLTKLSAHGGHVGPNLGMVEATIALHYVMYSIHRRIRWYMMYPIKVIHIRC